MRERGFLSDGNVVTEKPPFANPPDLQKVSRGICGALCYAPTFPMIPFCGLSKNGREETGAPGLRTLARIRDQGELSTLQPFAFHMK